MFVGAISGELGFLFISAKSFVQELNAKDVIPITEVNSIDFIFFMFYESND